MRRKLIILPLWISIILPLKWNILSFNYFKNSDIFNFIYLLRLRVLYLVNRVPFKPNKNRLLGF